MGQQRVDKARQGNQHDFSLDLSPEGQGPAVTVHV